MRHAAKLKRASRTQDPTDQRRYSMCCTVLHSIFESHSKRASEKYAHLAMLEELELSAWQSRQHPIGPYYADEDTTICTGSTKATAHTVGIVKATQQRLAEVSTSFTYLI